MDEIPGDARQARFRKIIDAPGAGDPAVFFIDKIGFCIAIEVFLKVGGFLRREILGDIQPDEGEELIFIGGLVWSDHANVDFFMVSIPEECLPVGFSALITRWQDEQI